MTALTEREQQVLDFVRDHIATVGYAPSVRQVKDGLHLPSTQTVHDVLGALMSKGAIRRDPGIPRGLVLLDPAVP